ncbi:hypothetical protein EYF80_015216 [Liparis tanakae]|uniref:Uncharacterized protein n=1 Tax=Liparis tanakae TaxID=230148 RepID=A0A4Z2I9A5_9TELE|nr:hypothetical protein EYF80_015216 [Liparis tanakae]
MVPDSLVFPTTAISKRPPQMDGNLSQLTFKKEGRERGSTSPLPSSSSSPTRLPLKPAGMLLGLDILNPTCPHRSTGSSSTGFP